MRSQNEDAENYILDQLWMLNRTLRTGRVLENRASSVSLRSATVERKIRNALSQESTGVFWKGAEKNVLGFVGHRVPVPTIHPVTVALRQPQTVCTK